MICVTHCCDPSIRTRWPKALELIQGRLSFTLGPGQWQPGLDPRTPEGVGTMGAGRAGGTQGPPCQPAGLRSPSLDFVTHQDPCAPAHCGGSRDVAGHIYTSGEVPEPVQKAPCHLELNSQGLSLPVLVRQRWPWLDAASSDSMCCLRNRHQGEGPWLHVTPINGQGQGKEEMVSF